MKSLSLLLPTSLPPFLPSSLPPSLPPFLPPFPPFLVSLTLSQAPRDLLSLAISLMRCLTENII